jgi:hypothetical protein
MSDSVSRKLLWQAVLLQVLRDIRDANRGHEGHKDFVTAARWVGTYPSREFSEARKAYAFLSSTVSSALRTSFVADLHLREQRLHRVFRFQKTDDIP